MWQGSMHDRGARQGPYVAGGVHDSGCMTGGGGVCGRRDGH